MKRWMLDTVVGLISCLVMSATASAQSFHIGGGGVGIHFDGGHGHGDYGHGGYGHGGYYGGHGHHGYGHSSFGWHIDVAPRAYGYRNDYRRYGGYDDGYPGRSYVRTAPVERYRVQRAEAQFPPEEMLALMNWRELGGVLREATGQLSGDLDRLATGAGWKSYLKVGALSDRFGQEVKEAPDAASVKQLQAALAKYESASSTPEYATITRGAAFRAVRGALAQFVEPAHERTPRRLSQFHKDLELALDELPTGAGWKKFLTLPEGGDPAAYGKALQRYQDVEANADYRMIAELPPFPATLDALTEYGAMIGDAEVASAPAAESPQPK